MKAESNTDGLWDRVWANPIDDDDARYALESEAHSIRFRRMVDILTRDHGGVEGLRVVEIGAGTGTYAALLGRMGADITVLDYSKNALLRSEEQFDRYGINAAFVEADALALPTTVHGQFDISMSFGLTEHFLGADRIQIHRAHLDVLRDGGATFVSVPNKLNAPYRAFKFAAERMGMWGVGEEYPFSRRELRRIFRELGVSDVEFFGESVWTSRHFVNPLRHSGKLRRLFGVELPHDVQLLRDEVGTPLDAWLAYAIVVYARKPARVSTR